MKTAGAVALQKIPSGIRKRTVVTVILTVTARLGNSSSATSKEQGAARYYLPPYSSRWLPTKYTAWTYNMYLDVCLPVCLSVSGTTGSSKKSIRFIDTAFTPFRA